MNVTANMNSGVLQIEKNTVFCLCFPAGLPGRTRNSFISSGTFAENGKQETGNHSAAISPHDTGAAQPAAIAASAGSNGGTENSWEYSGEFAANFVSARAQLSSWLQNQLWQPERLITLEENLKPRIILTFSAKDYELTLLLWKIKTDLTGFSYRRDKKSEPSGGIVQ